jgi:POT family proton-dependent oligopeptide transporter
MVDTPAVEEPFSVPSDRMHPEDKRTWFGHPRQLARLFTTEMWERFGYYGMRALLTLYLTKHFLFSDSQATGLYGGYTALVYLTPLVGGLLADQFLGSKRAVKFGAIIMALGYFTLAFGGSPAKPYATIAGQALRAGRRPALRGRGRQFRRPPDQRSGRSALPHRQWQEAADPRQ